MSMPSEEPPGLKGIYRVVYQCGNCGVRVTVPIKKGEPAPKKSNVPCRNCGCKTLKKE